MQIRLTSVMVDDQEKALGFYVSKLGFQKSKDIPMGGYRWLTLIAPEGADGVELVLEPIGFPPAAIYQRALFDEGIPATAFISSNLDSEYQRLRSMGVLFRGEPTATGPIKSVLFEDTCGNLISLVQPTG